MTRSERALNAARNTAHATARRLAVASTRRLVPIAERKNWMREAAVGTTAHAMLSDFNTLLHALRTTELGRMPPIKGTMLSAGCANGYYFEWIADSYQEVDKHIGLELYLPKPDVLPANVVWIANSVGRMVSVEDASVALVFSGQNIEHLFGDDATDFLLESHRVLEPDGWLVIDSPHRDVAKALDWVQPEHTVEFTPEEARELVELAGFDVISLRGLWRCKDPRTDQWLPLWGADGGSPDPTDVVRRAVGGPDDVENSFVWWLEARRADRAPDVVALRARHAEIFAVAWTERQQRLRHVVGSLSDEAGQRVVHVPRGTEGFALHGPYAPLSQGRHVVSFFLRRQGVAKNDTSVAARIEVTDFGGNVLSSELVTVSALAPGAWSRETVTVDLAEVVFGAQFRVWATGSVALDVRFGVEVDQSGTLMAPSALRS